MNIYIMYAFIKLKKKNIDMFLKKSHNNMNKPITSFIY